MRYADGSLSAVTVVFEAEVPLLELQARSMARHVPVDVFAAILVIDNTRRGLPDRARARTVVEKAYEVYKVKLADHNPTLKWKNDDEATLGFSVMGKTLEAGIRITDDEVRIEGDMPFLFRPFQGKVEKVLGSEIEKWLEKARAGEI